MQGYVLEALRPDREVAGDYIVQRGTQRAVQVAQLSWLSGANTERREYSSQGMLHTEGGWPRDVDRTDMNQLMRLRR